MQVFRYSGPEFDPYGDGSTQPLAEGGTWPAPVATAPLSAVVALPGSKSLTNRELVLSALAEQPSVLRDPLHSRDSALMIEALTSLGASVRELDEPGRFGADLEISPRELTGSTSVDTGLAGTVMRFLPPVAALATGPVAFDGDAGARRRPMRTTIESLRALGIDVDDDGRGALPFRVYGAGRVRGGELAIDASASSQFVSALLLAAPRFEQGITLRHTGESLPSLPHIEMTLDALRARGVVAHSPEIGVWVVEPGPIAGREVRIEPDLSNAAPFLAAALVAGGTVEVPHWPAETTQVGADLARLLPAFGADVSVRGDSLVVDGHEGLLGGRQLPGVELDLGHAGELTPALVALAALAAGPSRITGIAHLRGHETDRLAALVTEINRLGGRATELDDGLELEPAPLHGGVWSSYEDHRMAHAGAIVGLAVARVEIDDIGATSKTLPEFPELWRQDLLGLDTPGFDPLSLLL
jgi:3-phosphoshikimate 1-carboxyvinyltransferase